MVIDHLKNNMRVGIRYSVAQLTSAFTWWEMQTAQNSQKAKLGYIKH